MKTRTKLTIVTALAVACSALFSGCDRRPIKGHRYSTEITVTGSIEHTNADGSWAYTELLFTQKPTVATPIR